MNLFSILFLVIVELLLSCCPSGVNCSNIDCRVSISSCEIAIDLDVEYVVN